MNKLNHNLHTSQEKHQTKSIIYILELIGKCPKTFKKILAVLLKMDNLYKVISPSEEWLRKQVGCCRTYVSEVVKALMNIGIITVINRGWIPDIYKNGYLVRAGYWLTNIYKFSPLIYDHDFRAKLAALLPGCQALEYSLLMQFENQLLERKSTLLRPSIEKEGGITGDGTILEDCKWTKAPISGMMERNKSTISPIKENYGCKTYFPPSNFD